MGRTASPSTSASAPPGAEFEPTTRPATVRAASRPIVVIVQTGQFLGNWLARRALRR